MRRGLVVGGIAVAVLGGGAALGVQQQRATACERLDAVVQRDDYASFEEQQGAIATATAECMAEEARTGP